MKKTKFCLFISNVDIDLAVKIQETVNKYIEEKKLEKGN